MSVVPDVTATNAFNYGVGETTSPFTYSHSGGASANAAIIAVCYANRAGTGGSVNGTPSYGGVASTSLGAAQTQATGSMQLFAVKGISGGTQTVSLPFNSCSTSDPMLIIVATFTGVDQTTGWQNYNTAKATSTANVAVAITSSAGNLVVAAGCLTEVNSAITAVNVTDLGNFVGTFNGDPMRLAMGYMDGAGGTTPAWSQAANKHWIASGVELIASGGGGSSSWGAQLAMDHNRLVQT